MSGKNQKKLRQLVRRNENKLVDMSWNVFFETIAKMPKKQRRKIARMIIKGVDLRQLEKDSKNGIGNTRN